VLTGAGLIVIGLSFADIRGGDPLAIIGLSLGVLMVILGCLVPWVQRASAGPHGASVELRSAEEVAQLTTLLAEEPTESRTELVKAGGDGAPRDDELLAGARFLLAEIAFATLFEENEVLTDCNFHLYLLNEDDLLQPVFGTPDRSAHLPMESWKPGQGVVGRAWDIEAFVRAVGDECHDKTYGLTREQEIRYQQLQVVAAIPVGTASSVIGVVSADTRERDSSLGTEDGYREMVLIADLVARVLIDVLKWFEDD
jgi:hypothetical protein